MKKVLFIVACLVLIIAVGNAQLYEKGKLLRTYTDYSTATDTSAKFSVGLASQPVMNAKEVILVAVATDSIHATVYIDGYNSKIRGLDSVMETYTDSLTTLAVDAGYSATFTYRKFIVLKDAAINRLEACDVFRIRTDCLAAAQNGHTVGRTLKWYLYWVQ